MTRRCHSCHSCRSPLADHNPTRYCAACRLEARNGTLDAECWLPIPGFKGWEISQFGRVRDRATHRVRQPDLSHKYPKVALNGRRRYLHDLLAATFIGPKPWGEIVVRHIDDDPLHHHASNLVYGTHADNAQDRIANQRKDAR